jgi:hypothetical protein
MLASCATNEPLTVPTYFVTDVFSVSFLQFVSPTNITTAIRLKNKLIFFIVKNISLIKELSIKCNPLVMR